MRRFKDARLARMTNGRYCVIRDLGLVKGGKGLRHHEVLLEISWRGLFRAARDLLKRDTASDARDIGERHLEPESR
jgi:hypothetical protein